MSMSMLSSLAARGEEGAREGKVAAPPPKWIFGALFPAAGGSETAGQGSQGPGSILETVTFLQSYLPQFPSTPRSARRDGQSVQDTPAQTGRYRNTFFFACKTRQTPQPHTQNSLNAARGCGYSMVRYHRVTRRHGSRSDVKTQVLRKFPTG